MKVYPTPYKIYHALIIVCLRLVRDPRANYEQSLSVLEHAKKHNSELLTKTSLMLGLGETDDQILRVMEGRIVYMYIFKC